MLHGIKLRNNIIKQHVFALLDAFIKQTKEKDSMKKNT